MTTSSTTRPGRRSTATLAVLGVALAALIGWIVAAHGRPVAGDLLLHALAVRHRSPRWTTAAIAVTLSGQLPAYAVAAAGSLLALRPRPWWLGTLTGIIVLAGGQLIRFMLAVCIGRARPPTSDWAWPATGPALPSGHTTTATLAAGLLCLGLARSLHGARRALGAAVAAGWATAVGVSRVYLGVHWPTDVLAGWLLGAAVTVLAAQILDRTSPYTPTDTRKRPAP